MRKSDAVGEEIKTNRQILTTSTDKHDELTSKLTSLLDEMKCIVSESKNNNQMVRGVVGNLSNVEVQIQTDLTENLSAFNEFKNQMTNDNATMTTTLDKCESASKNIKSNMNEMVRVSDENEQCLVASIDEMNKNFINQQNVVTDKMYDVFNQIENSYELTRVNIDGGLHSVINEVTNEQDRIDAHQFEFDDTMTTLETTQKEFHETISNDIDFCKSRLQTFQTEELRVYTPTGQTPSKRNYSYPRVLAVTSPHGKIVKDFWSTHDPADLDCSAIISEVKIILNTQFIFI